jgi:hypothetical protein
LPILNKRADTPLRVNAVGNHRENHDEQDPDDLEQRGNEEISHVDLVLLVCCNSGRFTTTDLLRNGARGVVHAPEWARLHKQELPDAFELASSFQRPSKIEPLP